MPRCLSAQAAISSLRANQAPGLERARPCWNLCERLDMTSRFLQLASVGVISGHRQRLPALEFREPPRQHVARHLNGVAAQREAERRLGFRRDLDECLAEL